MSSTVEDYPLLSLLPEATCTAGHYGFVEAQLVLAGWHDDELTPSVRAELARTALLSAQWALQYQHLAEDGDWAVVSCDELPGLQIRLELVSWSTAAEYQYATRH